MRKFIFKILLFILPIIVLAVFAEYFLQQIPNEYAYKKGYLDKYSEEIQILVFGSSHTYYGINPVYFSQNVFNAGHVSQSLDFDFKIFDKYQNRHFGDLKMIILPISYFTLWQKLENEIEAWRIKNYALYYEMNIKSLSNYSEVLSNNPATNIKRLISYYIKHTDELSCNHLGWGMTYKSENAKDLEETGKTAALRHTVHICSEERIRTFTENMEILNSFAEICDRRNIKLVFLTTPVFHTYQKNLHTEQLNKTIETIVNFTKEHNDCEYINWFENEDFTEEDFFDADHLNEMGAEKLSLKLSNYIDSLEILK